jgi:hypothetical protein
MFFFSVELEFELHGGWGGEVWQRRGRGAVRQRGLGLVVRAAGALAGQGAGHPRSHAAAVLLVAPSLPTLAGLDPALDHHRKPVRLSLHDLLDGLPALAGVLVVLARVAVAHCCAVLVVVQAFAVQHQAFAALAGAGVAGRRLLGVL